MNLPGETLDFLEGAVYSVADLNVLLVRFKMNIACADTDGICNNRCYEPDNRGRFTVFIQRPKHSALFVAILLFVNKFNMLM